MRKPRAPALTDERIATIVQLLDEWSGKLTWQKLIEAVQRQTGVEYSRFTLMEKPRIAHAFELRKGTLRVAEEGRIRQPSDERLREAYEKLKRCNAKIARLEAENQLLTEQFVTWLVNAQRRGVSLEMLQKQLTKPDRDRTKGKE
jgi:hypothetical protein